LLFAFFGSSGFAAQALGFQFGGLHCFLNLQLGRLAGFIQFEFCNLAFPRKL
jgi:hypothetical protein